MRKIGCYGDSEGGTTLIELMISLLVFAAIALSLITLFVSLVHSTVISKRIAVASTLATNQMEYLKSLPYDSLTIGTSSTTKVQDGVKYTITSVINYIDDAYDGCGSYPNETLKEQLCRNYPPPSGSVTDTNPKDYKIAHVVVGDSGHAQLAAVDTEIAARVAETASSTGALFVSVLDDNGNPVSGASVTVADSTVSPAVDVTLSTDSNGVVPFYDLPPDSSGYDYSISASKSGYSSLATIVPSGQLQPTYPNQNVLSQKSSYVTLTLKPQGSNSLIVEAVDTSGHPLAGAKIYIKGGYKKYTSSTDSQYYYDNFSPTDSRPTTDASGLVGVTNLVPGSYIFCGDAGDTDCTVGGTTYYLAAAVPYGGSNPLNPINVPTYTASNPPATTYPYGGLDYLQKVRLILTTSATFPRVASLSPGDVSLSGGTIGSFNFVLTGTNLPCTASGSGCGTTVQFTQGGNTYTATCTGSSAGVELDCTVNLTGAAAGSMQMIVAASGTLTLPVSPLLGGLNVTP